MGNVPSSKTSSVFLGFFLWWGRAGGVVHLFIINHHPIQKLLIIDDDDTYRLRLGRTVSLRRGSAVVSRLGLLLIRHDIFGR
jgi:hypothetical protein